MTCRVADAHKALVKYVNEGMEFPDAETKVCREFNLTDAQVKEVRDLYDTPCEHEPAFTTVAPADADIQGGGRWIFDVNCKHCGLSGSFAVDTNTEIDW